MPPTGIWVLAEHTEGRVRDTSAPGDKRSIERGDEVMLVPDNSISAIRERQDTKPMSAEEFDAAFGDLPTDDEG